MHRLAAKAVTSYKATDAAESDAAWEASIGTQSSDKVHCRHVHRPLKMPVYAGSDLQAD